MRIAQVIKAKKLTPGVYVLVFNAEGEPSWNRVTVVCEEYQTGWLNVSLDGITDVCDMERNTRVVVWR